MTTVSEANRRDFRGKIKRKAEQREWVMDEVSVALAGGASLPERGPWYVRLTRVAPKTLDKTVNLPSALKAVEDAVAALLKVDDGSDAIETVCRQRKGKPAAVLIEVWGNPQDRRRS